MADPLCDATDAAGQALCMRRLLMTALTATAVLVSLFAGACGDDDDDGALPGGASEVTQETVPLEPTAQFTVSQINDFLDGGGLAVVRDQPDGIWGDVDPEPIEIERFATRAGAEFDVLLFADAAAAQQAIPSVADAADVDDGAITSAYNAVAVLPSRPDSGVSRQVFRIFRDMRTAGAREIALDDLLEQRDEILGASVTVTGDVVQRLPNGSTRPRAITLRGPGPAGEIVVAPVESERLDVPAGVEQLTVTGELSIIGRPGLAISEDGILSYRTGDPVIVADSVRPAEG
jgi:hypothetical protein